MIPLSKKWCEQLARTTETGMGYHIVTVTTADGRTNRQVVVDSGYITKVRGYPDVPFEENDIAGMNVTHDKWNFRRE